MIRNTLIMSGASAAGIAVVLLLMSGPITAQMWGAVIFAWALMTVATFAASYVRRLRKNPTSAARNDP